MSKLLITRPPIPALRPFVSLVWAGADTAPEQFAQTALEHVLPTGAMHLVIRLTDDPLRVYDSSDDPIGQLVGDSIIGGARSRFYVREMAAPSCSVGAALRAGVAELLFGVGADELAGRHTALTELWGASARSLRERLPETPTAEGRLAVLESALVSRLPHVRLMHPTAAAVASLSLPSKHDAKFKQH